MGFREDQLDSPGSRDGHRNAPAATLAPDSAGPPQKTRPQKPKYDGPAFDFAAPSVRLAEASLREAAKALEAALEVSLEDSRVAPASEASYRAAASAVDTALPPFHACYDAWSRAVLATSEAPTSCARGCGHCCSHYVSSVEPFELLRLHGRIRSGAAYPSRLVAFHRRASLYNSLLQGRRDEASDDRALFRYYLRDLPCPFLQGSGECGVYEDRPMSCRMFFSQSHPSLCRGKAAAAPGNRNFILEMPEDIEETVARASRRLEAYALPENLFEGLLEANALFGAWDRDEGTPDQA